MFSQRHQLVSLNSLAIDALKIMRFVYLNFFNIDYTIVFVLSKLFTLSVIMVTLSFFITIGFSDVIFAENIESPKKQLEKGIEPEDISCKAEHTLVILQSDKPACLSLSTLMKLEERGYIKLIIREFAQEKTETKKEIAVPNTSEGSTIKGDTGKASTEEITNIPASGGSIVNFYITDDDLNTSRNGVDIIDTKDLLQFLINGIPVEGPKTMVETGPNTGQFFVRLQLPDSINGKPITQGDVVEIKYLDESDAGGEKQVSTKSVPLSKTYAQVQTSGAGKTRIGHEFTVRIYEPDANLDSRDVNRIPLSKIEYRGEGGIKTTLANPVFDANASFLLETGENTGIFEVIIEIPRTIDGKTVHIGDWYEIRYVDTSTPSNTGEEIKLRGKIG